ncbi:tail fiber domain-containing protein [uncultured Aquimarina sp.]|uniref:tail fiber domain-containing protein n=1 Tax=uncultured Aquimarina sp. TaxID=575652 RepID=UPI00262C30D8|nr:tail fiber domain-containing protein [uncultured Aquimarina sp.]
MKKYICFLIAALCYGIGFSQTFNYQAVVRDAAGDPVTNQSVGVLVRIIEGSATGSVVYNEAHTVTSNDQGVITFLVGGGTSGANFLAIDWSKQNQWIDVQVDITGGTSYVQIGTSKLQFVPYAMYALNSNNATNAGPFDYTAGVVSNANGNIQSDDFVFGSPQLDGNGLFSPTLNNRMFFDKSKAAFRAGYTPQDEWDEANVGQYSVAFGESAQASGTNSFAMGRNANATGNEAFAFGTNAGGFGDFSRGLGVTARAHGNYATAIGRQVIANSMAEIQLGQYSTFVSGSPDTWVPTDRLFVIGNGQEDINLALSSDALVMLKNGNTTLNGMLTIDGDNQGAGTSFTLPAQDGTALQIMQTDGAGNVSWVTPAADAIPNGGNNGEVLSTDGSGNLSWISNDILPAGGTNGFVLSTDGSGNYSWITSDDADADATNEIELPVGGNNGQVLATDGSGVYSWVDQPALPVTVFSTVNNVTSNAPGDTATDDFVFGSTQINDITGANDNSRMFFDKSLSAFRAGLNIDTFTGFEQSNLGQGSAGFGANNTASGWYSATFGVLNNSQGLYSLTAGDSNTASNTSTVAMGRSNTASGAYSVALGIGNTASGSRTVTLGNSLTAESAGQVSLGYLNTAAAGNANAYIETDRLFVIGNGVFDINGPVNSDALVMLKNGNTAFSGNVGVGTTTPETTYALNVNGDLNYTGNLTNISDRRYKKNIESLSGSLGKIIQTEGVQYEMRKDEFSDMKFADGTQYGVIAQDIEKIFPNLVSTNDQGYKSVNYTGLIPVLVEALKEQQQQIQQQQSEITELKAEAAEASNLEKRLEAIEAIIKSQVTYKKN